MRDLGILAIAILPQIRLRRCRLLGIDSRTFARSMPKQYSADCTTEVTRKGWSERKNVVGDVSERSVVAAALAAEGASAAELNEVIRSPRQC